MAKSLNTVFKNLNKTIINKIRQSNGYQVFVHLKYLKTRYI